MSGTPFGPIQHGGSSAPFDPAPPAAAAAGGPLTEEEARERVVAYAACFEVSAKEFFRALDAYRDAVAAHHRTEGERLQKDFDWLKESYGRVCGRLQDLAQKYHLGLGGEYLDDIVVEAYEAERARAERAEAALRRIADDANDGRRDYAGVTAEHYRTLAKWALSRETT